MGREAFTQKQTSYSPLKSAEYVFWRQKIIINSVIKIHLKGNSDIYIKERKSQGAGSGPRETWY